MRALDLDPDMLCVAKAMSGGLAPIGAMIATAPIATSMEENDGTFYSTYGWHPRSVAAAIATLRDLKANRTRLLAGVAEMSEYFRVRLLQLSLTSRRLCGFRALQSVSMSAPRNTRTPSRASAAATGRSYPRKDRRYCCYRRW
jgi:acetylornithine/succinyldiaminopimelate/putrescine aminotransferase